VDTLGLRPPESPILKGLSIASARTTRTDSRHHRRRSIKRVVAKKIVRSHCPESGTGATHRNAHQASSPDRESDPHRAFPAKDKDQGPFLSSVNGVRRGLGEVAVCCARDSDAL
jgi:hypothetical protein